MYQIFPFSASLLMDQEYAMDRTCSYKTSQNFNSLNIQWGMT